MDPFIQELVKLAPALAMLVWIVIRLEARLAAKDTLLNEIYRSHCVDDDEESALPD